VKLDRQRDFGIEQTQLKFTKHLIGWAIPPIELADQREFLAAVIRQPGRTARATRQVLLNHWPYSLPGQISKQFFIPHKPWFITLHEHFLIAKTFAKTFDRFALSMYPPAQSRVWLRLNFNPLEDTATLSFLLLARESTHYHRTKQSQNVPIVARKRWLTARFSPIVEVRHRSTGLLPF
jgi:hypothetical protein